MRVYLTGFMGAGKTTVGRLLAARLGVPFVDLDGALEAATGLTIRELFRRDGEAAFRRREAAALRDTAAYPEAVVATGGGVVVAAENRAFLREHGVTVWLHVSFSTLLARLGPDERRRRPLLADERGAEALWCERLPLYREATFEIAVSPEDTPEAVADRLYRQLMESACAT